MPRPRFDKLDPEVRARVLVAAAQEFGSSSYDSASLNRIIEQAGISKGSFYYYFDDKEDLFRAVLAYLSECSEGMFESVPEDLNAHNFWERMEEFGRRGREAVRKHPWIVGFMNIFHDVVDHPPAQGPLKEWCERFGKLRMDIVLRGLDLGVIRNDLPLDLLLTLLNGVEMTMHRWMFNHRHELTEEARHNFALKMLGLMRRITQTEPTEERAAKRS